MNANETKTYQVRRDGPYTHLSVFINGKYLDGATATAVNFPELAEWLAVKHSDALPTQEPLSAGL